MALRRGLVSPQTLSSVYQYLYNDFDWLNQDTNKGFTIQSLVVSAPFLNIQQDLKILQELNNEYKDLGFELLVQRDIEERRVELEIVDNYLRLEGKTNFFPPIVVALIPRHQTINQEKHFESSLHLNQSSEGKDLDLVIGKDAIMQSFPADSFEPDEDSSEAYSKFFSSNEIKSGTLQWDLEKFHAIVIDGQHRFHALRMFVKKHKPPKLSQCFFPVNFVIITPEPGSKVSANQYVKTARELFIDINKNAKQVSHTRQILLDDLDLIRFLTRNSIKQYNITEVTEASPLFDWQKDEAGKHLPRIPQALINWNTDITERDKETIKFFNLAQVTSTSLIYKIIKDFIFKGRDYRERDNVFLILERIFGFKNINPKPGSTLKEIIDKITAKKESFEEKISEIEEELSSEENDDSSFETFIDEDYYKRKKAVLNDKALSFDFSTNAWLSDYFFTQTDHGKGLVMFYSRFRPFRKVIEKIECYFTNEKYKPIINVLIDPQHKNSRAGYKSEIPSEVLQMEFSALFDYLEETKREDEDVRFTVFQKAIFADFSSTLSLLEEALPDDPLVEVRLAKYFDALSILFENGVLRKDLEIEFEEPLFKGKLERDFSLSSTKVWLNVWINESYKTKYRDLDAFKINELIRIFAAAQLRGETLSELKENLTGRITEPLKTIRKAYKATYLKTIRDAFDDITKITEANSMITDDTGFENDLERVISDTIDQMILKK